MEMIEFTGAVRRQKEVKAKPAVMMYLKRASPIHRILSNQRIICSDGEPGNALNGSDAERGTMVWLYLWEYLPGTVTVQRAVLRRCSE